MGQGQSCLPINSPPSTVIDYKRPPSSNNSQEQRQRPKPRSTKNNETQRSSFDSCGNNANSWKVLISEHTNNNINNSNKNKDEMNENTASGVVQREIYVARSGDKMYKKRRKKILVFGNRSSGGKQKTKVNIGAASCCNAISAETTTGTEFVDAPTNNFGSECLFSPEAISSCREPPAPLHTIDAANKIYAIDLNLTPSYCQSLITLSEKCSRGSYTSYTYAKQTLSIREYPDFAAAVAPCVYRAVARIRTLDERSRNLVLDEREPHIVKYDLVKRERQKLDMHTDKSEWTFLIAISERGRDYTGGGTYFECNRSVVNVGLGIGIIFPGRLRHRGEKICSGRRFLIVGFMIEKRETKEEDFNTDVDAKKS
mmetsp:Transcript_25321/g.30653  ORF Transcript_25321/g.30653 Transcript_25321/m.30653 type:complete len:370 (+) Transcript_25321:85-1194(+)|eukprot:CAMPEP_0172506140 /NCGR_PEP_ID=MMETSP1066-20121228/192169_1 /TAXON_ID=671091 /ORGANISM="Coscinodiscus wailesii, Strain CCMP2513" /LENGTH=369 /DNA_ID=CAMNT_0013283027 /DNA_START=85 /DNA_END=1194 /DNA_ORIENTATION=-